MLFSSPEFLFAFLPISLLVFHLGLRFFGAGAALGLSVLLSLFFYGWWNPPYLALLAGSMVVNYALARKLAKMDSLSLLVFGITLNLGVLGYFKYKNFFLENTGLLLGETWHLGVLFIPLGISFFTFQQIALLIDLRDRAVEHPPNWLDFAQFISFFPQLIAGPIILYRELDDQFAALHAGKGKGLTLFGAGVVVFITGLFKKVCLADGIAPFADAAFVFSETLSLLEAWAGVLAYALQLYFDFSGYSDMAVGLGLMFGFVLPINFDTPFRASSMIDFWKRWHITMTRFFMIYIYSPLAWRMARWGAKRGWNKERGRHVLFFSASVGFPILTAFLLSGLWHGAGWTFVAFGAVNGIGLVANHAWREWHAPRLPRALGWGLTLICVLVSFVYFRAANMAQAHEILSAMFSPAKFILPNWLAGTAEALHLPWTTLDLFSEGSFSVRMALWIFILGLLSLLMANPAKDYAGLKPSFPLALATAFMGWMALAWLDEPRSFLYFQF